MTLIELISMVSTSLGGSKVTALPATSKIAVAALDNYPNVARTLLRRYPFPEATKYAQLNYEPGSPTNNTNFFFQYDVPSDTLKPLDIEHDEDADFRYEHKMLYTDYEEPVLRYTADIIFEYESDGTTIDYTADLFYSDSLARAIIWRLSLEIAPGNAPKMIGASGRNALLSYDEAIGSGGDESREKYDKPEIWTEV